MPFCDTRSEEATALALGGGGTWRAAPEGGRLLPPRSGPGFAAGAAHRQAASVPSVYLHSKHNLTPKRPHGVSGPYLCDCEDVDTMHQSHYVPDSQPLDPPSLRLSQQDLPEVVGRMGIREREGLPGHAGVPSEAQASLRSCRVKPKSWTSPGLPSKEELPEQGAREEVWSVLFPVMQWERVN